MEGLLSTRLTPSSLFLANNRLAIFLPNFVLPELKTSLKIMHTGDIEKKQRNYENNRNRKEEKKTLKNKNGQTNKKTQKN